MAKGLDGDLGFLGRHGGCTILDREGRDGAAVLNKDPSRLGAYSGVVHQNKKKLKEMRNMGGNVSRRWIGCDPTHSLETLICFFSKQNALKGRLKKDLFRIAFTENENENEKRKKENDGTLYTHANSIINGVQTGLVACLVGRRVRRRWQWIHVISPIPRGVCSRRLR